MNTTNLEFQQFKNCVNSVAASIMKNPQEHTYIDSAYTLTPKKSNRAQISELTGKIKEILNKKEICLSEKKELINDYSVIVNRARNKLYWWNCLMAKLLPETFKKTSQVIQAKEFINKELKFYNSHIGNFDHEGNGSGVILKSHFRDGPGYLIHPSPIRSFDVYEGNFEKGLLQGEGKITFNTEDFGEWRFKGTFKDGNLTKVATASMKLQSKHDKYGDTLVIKVTIPFQGPVTFTGKPEKEESYDADTAKTNDWFLTNLSKIEFSDGTIYTDKQKILDWISNEFLKDRFVS